MLGENVKRKSPSRCVQRVCPAAIKRAEKKTQKKNVGITKAKTQLKQH